MTDVNISTNFPFSWFISIIISGLNYRKINKFFEVQWKNFRRQVFIWLFEKLWNEEKEREEEGEKKAREKGGRITGEKQIWIFATGNTIKNRFNRLRQLNMEKGEGNNLFVYLLIFSYFFYIYFLQYSISCV